MNITAKIVPEAQRMDTADKHFGIRYPLIVEPLIYQFATQLAPAYSNLSFGEGKFGEGCADRYEWLYQFAMQHPESSAILGAND